MTELSLAFVTDIHQHIDNLRKIDFSEFDAVICGGDIINPSSYSESICLDILSYLPVNTYIIPGNCDTAKPVYNYIMSMKNCIEHRVQHIAYFAIAGIGKARALEDDIHIYRDYFIEDPSHIKEFINSGGSPFILKYAGIDKDNTICCNKELLAGNKDFFDKFISYSEHELDSLYEPGVLNNGILVSHSPPFGIMDKLPGLPHIGSTGVKNIIDTAKPSLVLSGHFHELHGIEIADGITFFNPGAVKDGRYGVIHCTHNGFRCEMKQL